MYDAAGGSRSAPGATTRIAVRRRVPFGCDTVALPRLACDEMERATAFGISLGVSISMNVPFSIQSAEIFQVENGNASGVAAVRSKTMPIGEYPLVRHSDFKRNFSAP